MLSCSTNCRSLRGGIYNKTVYIMNRKEVSLLFNGVAIVPKDLNTSFKSPDELSSILTTFDALNYCEGIYDPTLKRLDVSNNMGGSKDIFGVWRSKCCSFVAGDKKSALCTKCRLFKKYLQKRCKVEERKRQMESMKRSEQVNSCCIIIVSIVCQACFSVNRNH